MADLHPHQQLRLPTHPVPAWSASWIWFAGESWSTNFYGLARKSFSLPSTARRATLHISAYTDYLLRVDGAYIGRGPMPCDPWYQSFDSYDVTAFLSAGDHALAVVCHNSGIGTHRQHRGRGGLIVQLEIELAEGTMTIVSDDSWRLSPDAGWAQNAPRQFWSTEFTEVFDARQQPTGWDLPRFHDDSWQIPYVYGPHPAHPWQYLLPREIPLLHEKPLTIATIEHGSFTLQDIHAVQIEGSGIFYAQIAFYSEQPREVIVHIECDDAFKLFANGRLEIEQVYDEHFARTRMWRNKDEYEQVHYGVGTVGFHKALTLQAGWNPLLVVVDQGPGGWGFVLTWLDPVSHQPLAVPAAADETHSSQWRIAGPFESSQLSDSLATVVHDIAQVAGPSCLVAAFDYAEGATDCATLMRYEQRGPTTVQPVGTSLKLTAGEFCIVDLGQVQVTYPAFVLHTEQHGATLDTGYSQLAFPDHSIHFSNSERMKYVDRVILGAHSKLTWEPLQRRTGRYIHISCRSGSVSIEHIDARGVGYPVERQVSFACSDETLNRIWEISVHTTALLMQHGYQDCLKREQDTFNTSSFNYTSRAAALCFGDTALARKTLRLGAQLQNESGWFDSHGLSGLNSDEPTECLWWIVWLRDHYQISGDLALVEELFEPVEDVLRFFAKMSDLHGLLDVKNWHIFRPGQAIYVDDAVTYRALPTIQFYNGYSEGATSGLNMLYYAALDAATTLAEAAGAAPRASFYRRKAERVRHALNTRLWDPQRQRYADWRERDEAGGALSDSGHPVMQITATYFGISDEERTQQILRVLHEEMGLPDETRPDYPLYTFGYYFYWLESLFRNDQATLALDLLRRFHGGWLAAVPGGATTFGEYFLLSDVAEKKALTDEYEVHAYGVSAHLHFYTNILGVRPASPGFRELLLAPQPGNLSWARGSVSTPQGLVEISWEQRDDVFQLDAQIPEGVQYTLQLPPNIKQSEIRVNGRLVEQ